MMNVPQSTGAGARPGAAGGGGAAAAGPSPLGDPQMMQTMLKYLPVVMRVAKQIPGVLAGFFLTIVYMLVWVGRSGFRDGIAPVGGYHVMVLLLARELLGAWRTGQERAAEVRARSDAQRSFHNDIAMQYREKLD